MTVQGPVKKQAPDGMSHRGGGGVSSVCDRKARVDPHGHDQPRLWCVPVAQGKGPCLGWAGKWKVGFRAFGRANMSSRAFGAEKFGSSVPSKDERPQVTATLPQTLLRPDSTFFPTSAYAEEAPR